MTVKEVTAEITKIMKELEGINALRWEKRELTQKKINEIYIMLDELKKKLRGRA